MLALGVRIIPGLFVPQAGVFGPTGSPDAANEILPHNNKAKAVAKQTLATTVRVLRTGIRYSLYCHGAADAARRTFLNAYFAFRTKSVGVFFTIWKRVAPS